MDLIAEARGWILFQSDLGLKEETAGRAGQHHTEQIARGEEVANSEYGEETRISETVHHSSRWLFDIPFGKDEYRREIDLDGKFVSRLCLSNQPPILITYGTHIVDAGNSLSH